MAYLLPSWSETFCCDSCLKKKIANNFSSFLSSNTAESIMTRVPQGLVLRPLLFNLYINDMHKSSAGLRFINFADDSTIFSSSNDLMYLVNLVNVELRSLDSVIANKLCLNLNKTKYKVFSHNVVPEGIHVSLWGKQLSKVDHILFLVIHIDEKMTFKHHVQGDACKKISKPLGVIYRIKSYIPYFALSSIYF